MRNEYEIGQGMVKPQRVKPLLVRVKDGKHPYPNSQFYFVVRFNQEPMNHQIWNGVSAALIATVVGTAASSYAQTTPVVSPNAESNQETGVKNPEVFSLSTNTSAPEAVKDKNQPAPFIIEAAGIAKILPHELGGYQAATLYVHRIPVLTFLGNRIRATANPAANSSPQRLTKLAAMTNSSLGEGDRSQNDPVTRASTIASKINQFHRDRLDAKTITATWKPNCDCYAIKVQDQELVEINAKTILPDTTRNLAEDTRQATNRLRRLIGNAPPLTEIAGKPIPVPVQSQKIQVATATAPTFRYLAKGIASWYGYESNGNETASGETFNQYALTAAHRTLPFGTRVRVTNLRNGRSVIVRINDRGPYISGRIIDISVGAAQAIDMYDSGLAQVQLEVLDTSARSASAE
jgi:rare lipoprotein A